VYSASPRLDQRLLDAIAGIDDSLQPMAETYRRTRSLAAAFGLPRPSYERVRQHIHLVRAERERARVKRETLLAVALYQAPVSALYEVVED
jgi:hypothetical protein